MKASLAQVPHAARAVTGDSGVNGLKSTDVTEGKRYTN